MPLPRALLAAFACVSLSAAEVTDGWFPFAPEAPEGPTVIGMETWLDAPAGSRGPVRMDGARFVLGDGTPIRFWGVNLGNNDCAPEPADGARWAAFRARYGVNAVRLHKFIAPGNGIGDPQDSTRYTDEGLARFDRFTHELRSRGIYYGFSWVFEHSVRPADRARLRAYDELVAAGGDTHRLAVFIAEDVQDLRIEMLRTLLRHRNPHTGLTYAEDPALAFVELHNEDSIFFYTFQAFNQLDRLPTYRRLFNERFSRWLEAKYGDEAGLRAAWGARAFDVYETRDESLARRNIQVQGNPWFASPQGLAQARTDGTLRRVLDNAEFLHHVQGTFYRRFRDAIVAEGYRGPIVGSCWTTPAGVPQYYNLHNDWEVGLIDRHAYFGGMDGWRPRPGPFEAGAQLDRPGSGTLSSALLQTADRPFAMSEWTTVFPNPWVAESPSIVAVYGMGLQGWDASYHFASHIREYNGRPWARTVNDPRLWVVDTPHQLGLYPALARLVHRGDVAEGPVVSTRRVSLAELRDGGPPWMEREEIRQSWDFKEYGGAVPAAVLAHGRAVVEFTDEPAPSDFPDLGAIVRDGLVRSATGELAWQGAEGGRRGFFSVDTAGTKAVVGFAGGRDFTLGDVRLRFENPFATVFLTSLERDATIARAKSLLLVTMARVHNTSMRYADTGDELLEVGTGPMLLEPVRATVALAGRRIAQVHILDHDGRRTGRTVPVTDGTFTVDGAATRAFYYEVELR